MFLGALYLQAVVDMLAVFIGFLAVRKKDTYNIQNTLCFTMFAGFRFVIILVALINFLVIQSTPEQINDGEVVDIGQLDGYVVWTRFFSLLFGFLIDVSSYMYTWCIICI